MVAISTVAVDPPAHGPFLCRFPQPFVVGDDTLDWYVTTGGVTRKVQRDRLTDEIHWCTALVATGTTTFNVFSAANTSPATGWTNPTLTGLLVRWTGHDGSIAQADLTSIAVQDILRDGHNERAVRRWTHSVITVQGGASTQTVGTQVAGHHVYLHFRADLPDVVEIEILISNASTKIKTNGSGMLERTHAAGGLFGTFGFTDCELILPAGWARFVNRPLATTLDLPAPVNGYVSNAHAFPTKMATVRRWVIYKVATSGAALAAEDLLALKGLGRATSAGPRSYHTVRAYGSAKSLLPDLNQGYPGGYAAVAGSNLSLYNNLLSRVGQGIALSDGSLAPRMGLFHPAGEADPQGTGGTDIQTYAALPQTRDWVRYCMLYGDCLVDSNGVFMFNRTTGRPLRTHDFGDAYTNPNALAGEAFFADTTPSWLGMQPFIFYCQNNGGYCENSPHQWYFFGWIAPEWPTHFLDDENQTVPGSAWSHSTPRWLPSISTQLGYAATAPRSLLNFTNRFRPTLEVVPRFHSLNPANGFPWYYPMYAYLSDAPFGGGPFGATPYKDPADSQHACRMFTKYATCAYLGGDLLAIDVIDQYAEWFALEYSEVGHVPRRYAGNWPNDQSTPAGETLNSNIAPNNYSLLKRLAIEQQAPQTARTGVFRSEGWVGTLFALQYALASVVRREIGYTSARPCGIKKRTEMFYDFLRTCVLPNGATYRHSYASSVAGSGGQLSNAHLGDPTFGPFPPPIGPAFSIMQIGLELPIVHWGLFSLGRQLGRTDFEVHVMNAYRGHTALTQLYTNYSFDASVFGPMKYAAVWHTANQQSVPGQVAERYGSGSGTPGYPNHQTLVELAYRIQGAVSILATANHLGHHATGFPSQTPLQRGVQLLEDGSYRGEWDAGLIALLLTQPGKDTAGIPIPAQTFPTIAGSASPNPIGQGGTVLLMGTVTLGANPTSTGVTVLADETPIGGGAAVALLDDGVAPDETASDLIFTTSFDTTGLVTHAYRLPLTVTDAQGRRNTGDIHFTVAPLGNGPSIRVRASPNGVHIGEVVTLTAIAIAGESPASTGMAVTGNLFPLGGSETAAFLDDGVAPDVTAADLIFTTSITVAATTRIGLNVITIILTDAQDRSYTAMLPLSVRPATIAATNPQVEGSALRSPVVAGSVVTLLGTVTPGTSPPSTGLTVQGGLSALQGPTSVDFLDDGVAPDVSAGDLVFTYDYLVPADLPEGQYILGLTVTDAELRTGAGAIYLDVEALINQTDPRLRSAASPNPIAQGDMVTIFGTVTPGTSPASTDIAVTLDLAALEGSGSLELLDTGVAPDVTGGDLTFTTQYRTSSRLEPGTYILVMTATDAELRTATTRLYLDVDTARASQPPTDPRVRPTASQNPIYAGDTVTLFGAVTLGTSPTSTDVAVTISLRPLGGDVIDMVDTGVAPDATADDLVFTVDYATDAGLAPGIYSLTVTATDAQLREASAPLYLNVEPQIPIPPITPPEAYAISPMYDVLTTNVAHISQGGWTKINRYIRDGLNAPLLGAAVENFSISVYDESSIAPEVPVYSTGRMDRHAQNADATTIIKRVVGLDGSSPSPAGHTFEWMVNAALLGLQAGHSYRVEVLFTLIAPGIDITVSIPLVCDDVYGY